MFYYIDPICSLWIIPFKWCPSLPLPILPIFPIFPIFARSPALCRKLWSSDRTNSANSSRSRPDSGRASIVGWSVHIMYTVYTNMYTLYIYIYICLYIYTYMQLYHIYTVNEEYVDNTDSIYFSEGTTCPIIKSNSSTWCRHHELVH